MKSNDKWISSNNYFFTQAVAPPKVEVWALSPNFPVEKEAFLPIMPNKNGSFSFKGKYNEVTNVIANVV